MRVTCLVIDQCYQVFIENFFFTVCHYFEAREGIIQIRVGQRIAQIFQLVFESVTA